MATITWNMLTGTTATPGAIARWLNKSSLTAGDGGDADIILDEAISWIDSRLRHWRMLTAPVSGTMATGTGADQIVVPTDLAEPDFFMINGYLGGSLYQQELIQRAPNEIYRAWAYDGSGVRVPSMPYNYSFNQTYIQLDNEPDKAYPYVMAYYQHISPLSSTNTENFLTRDYQRLLRVACMMVGVEYVKENAQGTYNRTYWAQQAESEIRATQADSDNARRGQRMDARFDHGVSVSYGAWR
jgi:predicted secreted protein